MGEKRCEEDILISFGGGRRLERHYANGSTDGNIEMGTKDGANYLEVRRYISLTCQTYSVHVVCKPEMPFHLH